MSDAPTQTNLLDKKNKRSSNYYPNGVFDSETYLKDHPDLYQKFKERALELYEQGYQHYGAKGIVEHIRYTFLKDHGKDGYKVNNSAVSAMARKLADELPVFRNFFAFRNNHEVAH